MYTKDLDLGLSLQLLDREGYKEISRRLKDAGFRPDVNEETGHPTRQRWMIHVERVAARLCPLLDTTEAQVALRILEEDFTQDDHIGPARVARFLREGPDPDLQAEVVAIVRRLLVLCTGGAI